MSKRISSGKKLIAIFMSFVLAASFMPACSQPPEPSSSHSHTIAADVTRDGEGSTASAADLETLSSLLSDSVTPFGSAAALAAANSFRSDDDAWARIAADALRMLEVLPTSSSETEKIKQTHDLLDKVGSTLDAQTALTGAMSGTPAAELAQRSDDIDKNLKLLKAYLNDAAAALAKEGVKVDVDSKSGKVSITGLGISSADVTRAGKEAAKESKTDDSKEKSASASAAKESNEKADEASSGAKNAAAGSEASSASTKAETSKTPEPSEKESASSSSSSSADEAVSGNAAVQAYAKKLIASARANGTGREASFEDCCTTLADDYHAVAALLQAQGDQNPLASFDAAAAKALGSDKQQLDVAERGLRLKLKAQLEESMASLALVNGDDADSNQGLVDEFNRGAAALAASTSAPAESPDAGANAENPDANAGAGGSDANADANPSPAAEPVPEGTPASSWDELQNAINDAVDGATISLTDNVTADNDKTRIEVPVGKNVTLNLNGFALDRGLTSQGERDDGHVITVKGTLTLRDDKGGGRVTGGNAREGGGIFVDPGATLNLRSGAIAGNKATDGGGVFVKSDDGKSGTLNIAGGEISGNEANIGGGIVNHGTVIMAGGTVSNNMARGDWAGGVFVASEAAFTMNDGAIANNVNESKDGGGIYTEGTVTINGGTLDANNAKKSGGGVRINGGTTLIAGGFFMANTAVDDNGGAIFVGGGGELGLHGGEIVGNEAGQAGGAIFVSPEAGSLTLGGKVVAWTNKASLASDVFLAKDKPFEMTGPLENAEISVHLEGDVGTIAKGFANYNVSENPALYFRQEDGLNIALEGADVVLKSFWSDLQSDIDSAADGATIQLDVDCEAAATDAQLQIPGGKSIRLDLNGHKLDRNRESESGDGHVLKVTGNLTVIDSSATPEKSGEGRITGGNAREGGGIFIDPQGSVDLQGGSVEGNVATDAGGVFVAADGDKRGTLVVGPGGAISGNSANIGGGIVTHGSVQLDGKLTGNSTEGGEWGGGIYVADNGELRVGSGTIADNLAGKDGGGIHNEGGAVRVEGGTISGNTARKSGAGLRIRGGSVQITGGTFSENLAEEQGGGIYLNNGGTLDFTAGSIEKNTAYLGGGGIWVGGGGNLNVSGAPVVKENMATNTYLAEGKKLKVADKLSADADVGVFLELEAGTFTEGFAQFHAGDDPDLYFTPEAGCSVRLDDQGEARIVTSDWNKLQRQIDEAKNGDVIALDRDWKAIDEDTSLVIPEGKALIINLSGHRIDRARASATNDGEVITVNGTLTIEDVQGGGAIQGGNGLGGGIHVAPQGSLTLTSGSILGNTASKVGDVEQGGAGIRNEGATTVIGGTIGDNAASARGGGIYNASSGTLVISGGAIAGNSALSGGGICNEGTLKLEAGMIASNQARDGGGMWSSGSTDIEGSLISGNKADVEGTGNGGGLYVARGSVDIKGGSILANEAADNGGGIWLGATLNFEGGSAKQNKSQREGGGIYVPDGAVLNVQGKPNVSSNEAVLGKGILLAANENPDALRVNVVGKLELLARLNLATKNAPYALTRGLTESGSSKFVFKYSEDNDHRFEVHDDGELYLASIEANVWVSSWDELQSAINDSQEGQVIGLKGNINGDGRGDLTVDGKNVTVDLNGYTVDRKGGGHVFSVQGGSTFTLRDGVGTGVITGGTAERGGGIYIDKNCTCIVEGCTIRDNRAGLLGAGIYILGKLKMTGGSVTENALNQENPHYFHAGGGIFCDDGGSADLESVVVSGNTATSDPGGWGGGLAFGLYYHHPNYASSTIANCVIEKNKACLDADDKEFGGEGGGIYAALYGDGKLTITDTNVNGNYADYNGGGIIVVTGSVEMSGGSVSNNSSFKGAGVFVNDGTSFTANSVRIASNDATANAGKDYYALRNDSQNGGGIFNAGYTGLSYCSIVNNKCGWRGGGAYSYNTMDLENCTVSNNQAGDNGGGAYVYSNDRWDARCFTATGCVMSGNTAGASGGAICVDGRVDLTACMLESNRAEHYGGALYAGYSDYYAHDNGVINLSGASITDNECGIDGAGIWMSDYSESISIKEGVVIKDNKGDNLHLADGHKISVEAPLIDATSIGVTLASTTGTFTEGLHEKNPNDDPSKFFFATEGHAVIADGSGEACVTKSDWPLLQQQINATENGATLTLSRDWKACGDDASLLIALGKNITIDLAGHTIDRNLTERRSDGQVFTVQGELTVADSAGGGVVRGGFGEKGGGVQLAAGAHLNLVGGTLAFNQAKDGGGIYASEGVVAIAGGSVFGNRAEENGGGLFLTGEGAQSVLDMSGGDISQNTAGNDAGAVFLAYMSRFNLSGGSVSGNEAAYRAGGILCLNENEYSEFVVKGSPVVSGNRASIGKNILVGKGSFVGIEEKLVESAKLDVATTDASVPLTYGFQTSGSDQSAFTYEGKSDAIVVRASSTTGNNELFCTEPQADVWVSDWGSLKNAINDTPSGQTIGLKNDVTAGDDDEALALKRPNDSVAIELAGHKIDRNLSDEEDDSGHVFDVSQGTLTIRDTPGTGRVCGGYDENGGGIVIGGEGHLAVEGGSVVGNRADDNGGGIYVYGTLEMTGGAVSGNRGSDCGGIYVHSSGTANLKNVLLTDNEASDHGGGAMNNKGKATLESCEIRSNKADAEGGGIYNGDAELTISNCIISQNSSPSGGGICCFGTVTVKDTTLFGNHAGDEGGAVYVHGTFDMTGGEIADNSASDCGGIYTDGGTMNLESVKVTRNRATERGGAGVNNKGQTKLTNCEISDNQAVALGGGIFSNGDIALHDCVISGNHANEDGGGMDSDGTTTIANCTIANNTTDHSGGGLRIRGGTVNISGGMMIGNVAKEYGGGIYVNNKGANLTLTNSAGADVDSRESRKLSAVIDPVAARITGNRADIDGGGIWVESDTGSFNVGGKVGVFANEGASNIHLASGKRINVNGELAKGSNIGVSLADELGTFTSNYAAFNPHDDPTEFFASDEDFRIVRNGDEVELKKWIYDPNEKSFIDWGTQIVGDYHKLNSVNWMAGISGEKYLYEINLPGTHDSGTKSVEGNISTGNVSKIAAGIGSVAGLFLGGIFGGVGGGLSLPVIVSNSYAKYAKCQDRYIDEQLADGIRKLDIRLDTYYAEQGYPPDKQDDGENLWIVHGKDKSGGSYFGKDSNGDFINFKEVLGWCKDFLSRHPTETIIVSVQIDSVDDVQDEGLARIERHLRQLSQEINPATNESFLYMEDGAFNRVFSRYPQLKDCRGKIVIDAATSDMAKGGFGGLNTGMGLTVYRPEGDFHDHADEKIAHLTAFYAQYAGRPLATDASTHIDYYYSVGTNGTDDSGLFNAPTVTPIEIAEEVLPVMFDDPGLVVGREGTYLGLVNMDREHARETGIVWKSNYFEGLEYVRVTAKSGLDGSDEMTCRLLKNTPITLPENLYDAPASAGAFKGWKAVADDSESKVVWSGRTFQPGATLTISEDVTFTAQWTEASDPTAPVNPTEPTKPDDPSSSSSSSTPESSSSSSNPGSSSSSGSGSEVSSSSSSGSEPSSSSASPGSSSGSGSEPSSSTSSSSEVPSIPAVAPDDPTSGVTKTTSSASGDSEKSHADDSADGSKSSSGTSEAADEQSRESGGAGSNSDTADARSSSSVGKSGSESDSSDSTEMSGNVSAHSSAGGQDGKSSVGAAASHASDASGSQQSNAGDLGIAVPQIIVGVLALGLLAFLIWLFRRRKDDDGQGGEESTASSEKEDDE